MSRSVFVLVNGILFNMSNGLMIKCFNSMFEELKEVKCFKKITDFKSLMHNIKYFKESHREELLLSLRWEGKDSLCKSSLWGRKGQI